MAFEQAWLSFKQIRYLNLGAASRADWVANIILYIPLTFSLATYFTNKVKSAFLTFLITSLILAGSITLAITIEFCQQFFPPRTVSQNDLIAETIGSIIGLALWFSYGKQILKLHTHILIGGKNAFLASASLYTLCYFVISFFPYDFVTSFQELQNKLTSGNDDFLLSTSCGNLIRCSSKLTSEILLTIPLGIFFSVLLKWHRQRRTAVMLTGFIVGAIIEAIQLFLISGIAQGISIFTRILGMGLGEILYKKIIAQKTTLFSFGLRKYIVISVLPYLILLAGLNGWSLSMATFDPNITEKLAQIKWLPFYYHYYTTESVALTSLLSVLFMYLPVGLGMWLWNNVGNRQTNNTGKTKAGLFASGLTLLMEMSKLYLVGKHPDPTNCLIAFFSAYLTYSIADVMYLWFHQPETVKNSHHYTVESFINSSKQEQANQNVLSTDKETGSLLAKIIAVLIFTILSWKIIDYPGSSLSLGLAVSLYAILLFKYPHAWLLAIPALLPVLNFSPWTGRIFFTELDYLILTTITISYWHGRTNSPFRTFIPATQILLGVYTFFYFISMVKGLLPFQPLDDNAFIHYYSHYNSLRIAKGLSFALFLFPILSYNIYHQKDTKNYFIYGILSGLAATSLVALWERTIFTGLFDFSSDFRISASFFSMHTGGAHLDAYLLLSIPFICVLLTKTKYKIQYSFFAILLFIVSLYTLLMTFSRGAYIAFAIEFSILCSGLIFYFKREILKNWKNTLWFPVFIVVIVLISSPVLKGSFIQHRFKQFNEEVNIRSSHWINSINIMETDLFSTFFGMGLGSFPRNYFWKNLDDITPATFSIQQEQNNAYLQFRGGAPLYIEQNIAVFADTAYKLRLDYRSYSENSGLSIQICEKAIQHSFNCQAMPLRLKNISQNWQHFEQTITTKKVGRNHDDPLGQLFSRPVKLILYNGNKENTIDIKNITLTSPTKNNLVKNGDFSEGMDFWFFTTDNHIPWRTENLWIQILFEQGWLGLLSFTLLLLITIIYLYQKISEQDFLSAVFLSSLSGFIIISVVDSTFDAPKITLLFFLLLAISFSDIKVKTTKKYT